MRSDIPAASVIDDADLLASIGSGDRTAMKALYDRHSRPLFNFIRMRVRDMFEASDLMQETFLEVWRSADRFEGRSSAKTWLFAIARNKTTDRLRRAGRTEPLEPDASVPDDAPTPERVAEAASDAARLRACIERLSDAHRAAVRLAFYDDLTYPEVAAVEGVPVGTIKTRIHHAKRQLMACITGPARPSAAL